MLPALTSRILDDWRGLFPDTPKPRSLRYLGVSGAVEGGTTTFLGFGDRGAAPLFSAKIHRDVVGRTRSREEQTILEFLDSLERPLGFSFPRAVLCEEIHGAPVLVQTIVSGSPMRAATGRDGGQDCGVARANIELASRVLTRLHEAGQDGPGDHARELAGAACALLASFVDTFDLSAEECDYAARLADTVADAPLFAASVEHGDFCRHNLLVSGKASDTSIGVVDWTDSRRAGFPLHDLYFFLATCSLQSRKEPGLRGMVREFEDMFLNPSDFSAMVRRGIRRFCDRVGVDPDMAEALLALFLIESAVVSSQKTETALERGLFKRTTLYIAGIEDRDFDDAWKAQYWVHFFKAFAARHEDFVV